MEFLLEVSFEGLINLGLHCLPEISCYHSYGGFDSKGRDLLREYSSAIIVDSVLLLCLSIRCTFRYILLLIVLSYLMIHVDSLLLNFSSDSSFYFEGLQLRYHQS